MTSTPTQDGGLVLRLYISGLAGPSRVAVQNLRRLADHIGRCQLEIVDVLEHPELAEDDRIMATPTLIRRVPPPRRHIIGDLSDTARVLKLLGFAPPTHAGSTAAGHEPEGVQGVRHD